MASINLDEDDIKQPKRFSLDEDTPHTSQPRKKPTLDSQARNAIENDLQFVETTTAANQQQRAQMDKRRSSLIGLAIAVTALVVVIVVLIVNHQRMMAPAVIQQPPAPTGSMQGPAVQPVRQYAPAAAPQRPAPAETAPSDMSGGEPQSAGSGSF